MWKMEVSRNDVKKRKESMKALHRLDEKSLKSKSKSKGKLSKLSKNKIKQDTTKSIEFKNGDTSKRNKIVPVKLIKKKLSESVQEKVNTIQRLSYGKNDNYSDANRNIFEIQKSRLTKSKYHMDGFKLSESQDKKNAKSKNNEAPKHVSKRIQNNKRVTVNSEENTDTLNLNNLSKEHIVQCISAIFHLTEEQLKNKNALFDGESSPVFMQVTCIKIPKTPKRCLRILLPYSIVSSNDEVALIVSDLEKGRRKDYEPTIEYYEDLLRKHGCTNIKNIIPMNQVKTEFDQFELKRKLVNSYDHFLVDGKIAGHLSHLLGKEFYKKRKLPTSIRMQSKDLKHEIDHALKKTLMKIHSFGDTHIVQIGHTLMKIEDILENVLAVCSYLSKYYPGGWTNVRSVSIKSVNSLALPIYTTLRNKNSVKVPVIQPKRPKAYRNVSGELSTTSGNAIVTITPEGSVTVEKKRKITKRLRNTRT